MGSDNLAPAPHAARGGSGLVGVLVGIVGGTFTPHLKELRTEWGRPHGAAGDAGLVTDCEQIYEGREGAEALATPRSSGALRVGRPHVEVARLGPALLLVLWAWLPQKLESTHRAVLLLRPCGTCSGPNLGCLLIFRQFGRQLAVDVDYVSWFFTRPAI